MYQTVLGGLFADMSRPTTLRAACIRGAIRGTVAWLLMAAAVVVPMAFANLFAVVAPGLSGSAVTW